METAKPVSQCSVRVNEVTAVRKMRKKSHAVTSMEEYFSNEYDGTMKLAREGIDKRYDGDFDY
jgi:hypothetical protein